MKTRLFQFPAVLFLAGISIVSCNQNPRNDNATEQNTDVLLKDYGMAPTVLNIDEYTMSNDNFRTALVLYVPMCLK